MEEGLDPITAIRMATLNAAECFGLDDRGAIAPGYRADIVLLDDLKDFSADKVWVAGQLTADQGKYLPEVIKEAGYEVTCLVRGLGELEPIQQLFVEHAKAAVDSLAK